MKVSVIVVAAGSGRRFGYERNKLFYPLCGKPVLNTRWPMSSRRNG
ncbi:hypothetical protein HMPREF0080_01886 [Anaeroglobus geminatus F0357]|uniref:MobA-like NTP transferase domain-containing protein n=1 Tax=Anaeroglobus geminatus F0357 TaxID=861450 RepID=G9YJN3_9FIRM|nr:hypothetical protein HMPREF0080_01886 [Anaeroglobus geminatus F0357]